ncbi:hypothetical protein KI387_016506, partial [Taxus chinensis]
RQVKTEVIMGDYQVTHIQLGNPTTKKLKQDAKMALGGIIQKVDKDKGEKKWLKENIEVLSTYVQKWIQPFVEGQEISPAITPKAFSAADGSRETIGVMDRWKEELSERGIKIIEDIVRCYDQMTE